MEMVGLDCVEDKDLIQKWFESRFLNMSEVQFADYIGRPHRNVYDTIQNGVKKTLETPISFTPSQLKTPFKMG